MLSFLRQKQGIWLGKGGNGEFLKKKKSEQ